MAADDTDKNGHGRDQAIVGLLRHTLDRVPDTVGECPSAEIVAAYYEQALDERERACFELHMAKCADCRELLSAIGRAARVADSREAQKTEPVRSNGSWLWDWRWLAPATAALALAGIWFARPRESERVARNFSDLPALVKSRPVEPVGPAPPEARQEDRSRAGSVNALQLERQAPAAKKSTPEKPPEERKELALNAPKEAETDALKNNLEQTNRDAVASDAQAAQPAAPRALNAPSSAVAGAIASPAASALDQAQTGARRMTMLKAVEQRSSELRIPTPEPNVIWRMSGNGFVERSIDSGKNWQAQQPRVGAQILAGSAPSATVCWLAGRAGLVLVTTDGLVWTTASAPAHADLVSIVAHDASSAMVATADGKRFSTVDGGKTWIPQP